MEHVMCVMMLIIFFGFKGILTKATGIWLRQMRDNQNTDHCVAALDSCVQHT